MRVLATLMIALAALAVLPAAARAEDEARTLWVYEGGWFEAGKADAWSEYNEEQIRKNGKPAAFRELARTKEYVEIRDAGRRVTLRLTAAAVLMRWDDDGKDADFKELYKGKWKSPTK